MKPKKKNVRYLRRSDLLPNLTKINLNAELKKRKSEEFEALSNGYFIWRVEEDKDIIP